jgi:hypothetical protein
MKVNKLANRQYNHYKNAREVENVQADHEDQTGRGLLNSAGTGGQARRLGLKL